MSWFKSTPESEALLAEERLVLAAAEAVDEALLISGTNRQQLAELLNVKPSEISQRLSGRRNLTLRSLARMLHVLGWQVELTIAPKAQPPVEPESDDCDQDWDGFRPFLPDALDEIGELHWQVDAVASVADLAISGSTRAQYEVMGVLGGFARPRSLDDDNQSTMAACK